MRFNRIVSAVVVSAAFSSAVLAGEPVVLNGEESANQLASPEASVIEKLDALKSPVQKKASECRQELESVAEDVSKATELHDQAFDQLKLTMARVEYAESILDQMCSSICIDGVRYTKEDVAAAMADLVVEYRAAKQTLDTRKQILTQRIATAAAVEVKVAKWQKAERDLLREISLLKAEHDLLLAGADNTKQLQQPSIVRSERLLRGITDLFPKGSVIKEMTVSKVVPEQTTDVTATQVDPLLDEVDTLLDEATTANQTP